MRDFAIELDSRPGGLAAMGEVLGDAGVSVEGGAAFTIGGRAIGHFLFHDPGAARAALNAAEIPILQERDIVAVRLNRDRPGQLGAIARRMASAGVNIEVVYSDHDHRLILVVDDVLTARRVVETW